MKRIPLRLFAALLAVALLSMGVAGCQKPQQEPPAAETPAPTEPTAPTPTATVEVPEFTLSMETVSALNSMQPVYDSLMRATRDMPAEFSYYQAQNQNFFWSTLYYLCVNYGAEDPRNTLEGTALYVPYTVMEEYAAACFLEYVALIPLPEEPIGLEIDEAKQAYKIAMSDAGEDYVTPMRYAYNASDVYEVMVAWLAPGEGTEYPDMLGAYTFLLTPNLYNVVNAIAEPMFQYSVQFAYEEYTDLVLVKDTYERNGQKYAVVDHVVREFHNAFDLDENGEPYGDEWDEVVNDTEESIEVLVSDLAEFEISELGWLFEDIVMEDALEDPLAFFMESAKRQYEGEHLLFKANIYDGVLYYAVFVDDNYSVG